MNKFQSFHMYSFIYFHRKYKIVSLVYPEELKQSDENKFLSMSIFPMCSFVLLEPLPSDPNKLVPLPFSMACH